MQAVRAAREKAAKASASLQQLERLVANLEVAIPKLQLEAGSARQRADDLQHRLAQLSQATEVGVVSGCPALHCSETYSTVCYKSLQQPR